MTPENLKTVLSAQFELLLFEDLANLLKQHRSIFDSLKLVYRSEFEPNQRIVFYTSHDPEQELLDHIQRAATQIDVSNFFILIVCPHDISQKLLKACQHFGDPNSSMQSLMIPIIDSLPINQYFLVKPKTLCPLPFAMLSIEPNGKVSPCCKFKGHIGNARDQSLDEIFYSNKAQSLRQQMIKGEYPDACQVCWQAETLGTKSLRSHAMDKYGVLLHQYWLDDTKIRDITWSPTILCNFKCRICSPNASSSIAAEEIQFSTDTEESRKLKISLRTSTDILPSIQKQILNNESLEYLHLLGGEPLLWPQIKSLINDLISRKKSQKIHLEFNTNGSVYDDLLMHQIIDNFAALEVLLSIDNIEERFEIERGGSWPQIKNNIAKFASLNGGNTKIKIAPTVNIQNIMYLDDVCDFAQSLGLDIVWWYLEQPAFLCIDYVTLEAKKLIMQQYSNSLVPEIQKILQRIQQAPMSDGKLFIEYANKIDSRRNQRFDITHREIFDAMTVAKS